MGQKNFLKGHFSIFPHFQLPIAQPFLKVDCYFFHLNNLLFLLTFMWDRFFGWGGLGGAHWVKIDFLKFFFSFLRFLAKNR